MVESVKSTCCATNSRPNLKHERKTQHSDKKIKTQKQIPDQKTFELPLNAIQTPSS